MAILSGKNILELVAKNHLVIKPFEKELIQPASYDLRLGPKILASPLSAEKPGIVIELSEKSPTYEIQPGQMVGVLSLEKIEMPLDICGRFGIRSSFARRGINAFGGLQLDPGFRGRLIENLLNVGPEAVAIRLHESIFTVEFQRLEEPAEIAYSGPFQDQDDFPAEQYNYILQARTTSLAEIPLLRKEMSRFSVILQEFEENFPDPDEGLELRQEIKERLLRSAKLPRDFLLSPSDITKKLN